MRMALASHMCAMSAFQEGYKILDLACGAGTCALSFAQAGCPVLAVDYDQEMLKLCRSRVTQSYLDNVVVVGCDATNLPFQEDSFDIVTGLGALHPISNRKKVLSEAYRVLKTSGQLVLGDMLIPGEVREVWEVLSVFLYGKRHSYLEYGQLQELLHNAKFQVEGYQPFRWIYSLGRDLLLSDHAPKPLQQNFIQAILDMDPMTKQALRIHELHVGCQDWVQVYDCFVLRATKFSEQSRWQFTD